MPLTKIPSRVSVACIAAMLAGCPEPTGSEGDTGTTVVGTEDSTSTETTDGGCPVGIEGCPCSDALSCFPGLECVDGLCAPEEPVEPCPVGSAGCPCTNAGTCDPGSVCEDGVCTCTPGEFGCACLDDGGCFDGLDCTDGLCEIPELISEAANGWGPVTCWADRGQWPGGAVVCYAAYGGAAFQVIPACEIAIHLIEDEWMPWPSWPFGDWYFQCAGGQPFAAVDAPWTDGGCFLDQGSTRCLGRIGHLWVELFPECSVAPIHEFDPWGAAFNPQTCGVDPLPPPDGDAVDEWRCGTVEDIGDACSARFGNHWTRPFPLCYGTDPEISSLATSQGLEANQGWPLFTCL
jgi:hypothetical protein